ncbi:MAG: PLP-dependent aminotransferase family protein [Peptococcaceae bacterium]|jgi:DNA-binding transcriptional MocR family regulator|nr:PLP-dependent aminotransferase family protein [Peptococcaceae bacterium]
MRKYEAVIEFIMKSVYTGNLCPGDFLPSIRAMSQNLGVSNVTVYDAYCRLERKGLVRSKERKGFILNAVKEISAPKETSFYPHPLQIQPVLPDIQVQHFKNSIRRDQDLIQLGAFSPPNQYFPNEELSKCLTRIIRAKPQELNTYDFSSATSETTSLVEKMTARYMFQFSGTLVSEAELFNTTGAWEGVHSVLSALTNPGDLVIMESPGFPGYFSLIQQLRLISMEIETLPPYGLNVDKLQLLLETGVRPACILVTPNYQNPTGSLMPLENRHRLLEICQEYDIIVVEDDVMGPLRFGSMLPTLKSLLPESVIYVSSYSKTISPGYRLGWVAAGKHTMKIRNVYGMGSFAIMRASQEAVAQYIASGKCHIYLKNLRRVYQKNCEQLADAIERSFPEGTAVYRPEGGSYLWVAMPGKISAEALFAEAMRHHILLAPGNIFTKRGEFGGCMRFCYAMALTAKEFDAVELVGNLAKKMV